MNTRVVIYVEMNPYDSFEKWRDMTKNSNLGLNSILVVLQGVTTINDAEKTYTCVDTAVSTQQTGAVMTKHYKVLNIM